MGLLTAATGLLLCVSGNAETLAVQPKAAGLDVRQAVVDFHEKYYSANIMRLSVYGRQDLDTLEQMVRSQFAAVPNQGLPVPEFPSDVFCAEVSVGTSQLRGHALTVSG